VSNPHPDRSPWNVLLLVPIVISLIPSLFNSIEPKLLGIPAFYWLQLVFIVISVAATLIVYRMTRRAR
jgi:hypothetical protein